MDAIHQPSRRRKGQTLAEFAITLPILLVLLFGIIEFGRIFQAWVTLQNAARTAARYASTGQPFVGNRPTGYDLNTLIPCFDDPAGTDNRGSISSTTAGSPPQTIQVYSGGSESLFATYFDGENCEPGTPETGNRDHYYMRADLVRMVLIYLEARRGAAGLALEPDPYEPINTSSIQRFLYDNFARPLPRSQQPSWFHIMICSSRAPIHAGSSTLTGGTPGNPGPRFNTVLTGPNAPYCQMNEVIPPGVPGALYNAGRYWMDPGGPGDGFTIVVSFNHPLITPLGLANFLPLQARRTGVNEAFRTANAAAVLQGSAPILPQAPTDTPTFTPTATSSPTPTLSPTATFTPSRTPTNEPPPTFTCSLLSVRNFNFFQNRFYIDFVNQNRLPTTMTRAIVNWAKIPDYPNMSLGMMSLGGEIHWQGRDLDPSTDTNADPGFILSSTRTVQNQSTSTWEGIFLNGPTLLTDYLTQYNFAGTTFHFSNPSGGPDCVIVLELPLPTPSPTRDVVNPPPAATATFTPDCAASLLRLEFVSWDSFGVVKLQVVNNRTVVAPFTNFSINWGAIVTRNNLSPGILTLRQVTVGGSSPADPLTYRIWQSSGPDQDASSPTVGKSEGTWGGDYTFPPRSVTPVYLDFEGTTSTLVAAFAALLQDFNGSWFEIGCGPSSSTSTGGGTGGTGGSGSTSGGSAGQIFLNGGNIPTVPPTNTRGPTNTPRPTFTPSITPTRGPATATRTPGPTNTTRPTSTATYTSPPPTNTPQPRDNDTGGG